MCLCVLFFHSGCAYADRECERARACPSDCVCACARAPPSDGDGHVSFEEFEAGVTYFVGLDHSSTNRDEWKVVAWKTE